MKLGRRKRAGVLAVLVAFELFTFVRLVQVFTHPHRDTGVFWSAVALIVIVFLVVLRGIVRLRRASSRW